MRNLPGYPTDTDNLEPVVRVVHGGKDREVGQVSLRRELPSSYHEQVVGIGGITQATGSVDWSPLTDVVQSHPTAFNRISGWPPKTRDAVDIYTGLRTTTGDLEAKQLTGFISNSSGDPLEGVGSGLVDRIARLSNRVTLPPLQAVMPPLTDGGQYRNIGLYPTYFTDVAARASRFYATPPMSVGCVLSAPLMGSAWPERGTVTECSRASVTAVSVSPVWVGTTWGMSVRDANITYTPSGVSTLNRAMEVTGMFTVLQGSADVQVMWGGSTLSLVRLPNSVLATMGGFGIICSMPTTFSGGVTMRVVPSGGNIVVTLRDQAGNEATGTVAWAGSGSITAVNVSSDSLSAGVGGVQVSFPPTPWTAVNYVRTAYLGTPAHNVSLVASPPIINATAKSILEDQSKAELAALWLDGDGNMRWVNRNALTGGDPVMTLSSQDNLKTLPWEEDFAGVASTVEITGKKATTQRSTLASLPFWEANASGVEPGDSLEWLIHPDTDTDWIMPDTTVGGLHAPGSDGFRLFNRGMGSWTALRASRTDGLGEGWAAAFTTVALVDPRTYRVATSVFGYSSGNESFEFTLKVPSPNSDAAESVGPMRYQPGLSTPVIRGKALTMWEDVTYTAAAGDVDAPVLSHDVGWYVQDPAACQVIADILAASTTTPRPFLREVSIVPDARLQLGDIVTLSDPDITGVEFKCLVVGISDSFSSGPTQWDQSCNFRVLDYTVISVSLSDLDAAWADEMLTALDAARANETLTQFDAQPLKGAPQ